LLLRPTRHDARHSTVTSTPNPALVSQDAVQRLPRLALLVFCASYLLPGLFGRDPWRGADQTAFGFMLAMAEGRTSWLTPTLGGLMPESAVFPHWIGAASIALLSPSVDPALAARLPFGVLLALVLVLTWYAAYHLARTDAAQPVAFAFGGEARPIDYARAVADGALLALIATLGLLQLGHETTPELMQLCAASLALWAVSAAPFRARSARAGLLLAFPLLSASGAPTMALLYGVAAIAITMHSRYDAVRTMAPWAIGATALAALTGWVTRTWAWRIGLELNPIQLMQMLRLFAWFLWPAWLLALWTLWRWRQHLARRHIAAPLALAAIASVACVASGGLDRPLMLGLPGFAVLAAFALPTLRRGTSAAIDWFSVFFFSVTAIAVWVIYIAMVTGVPAQPAANVAKLAPGFVMRTSWSAITLSLVATLAWLALVRWRTGRHRHALWKSLVLPAGGVALSWLLLMTLWLPLLDYARSNRPWVERIAAAIPAGACVGAPGYPHSSVAALEQYGHWRVDALEVPAGCDIWLRQERRDKAQAVPEGWTVVARVRRPTDREETTLVLQRLR
jgi:4-amino-4-deoxy-L-arabinose transferase-like glycosyltransferase